MKISRLLTLSPRKLAEKDLVEVREELSEIVDHFLRSTSSTLSKRSYSRRKNRVRS